MWTGGFHKYEHLHTVVSYIFTKKKFEHWFEHDVDRSYGVLHDIRHSWTS